MSPGDAQVVDVGGRPVRLTHLDRVIYPATGTTKAEVVDYYARIAHVLLPQLRDRPVSRKRFPQGVGATGPGATFFEKNVPGGAPTWVRRQTIPAEPEDEGSTRIEFPFVDDVAGLVWLANLSALELHTPQWRVGPRGAFKGVDRLVVDLDPGTGAGLAECASVAHLVAERLGDDGLDTVPVTSGSKGMQLYAPWPARAARAHGSTRDYAKALAEQLARDHRRLVVSDMKKTLRSGKVLVDWSQNHLAKTTVTPYSLRGRELPRVAAPRAWAEVGDDLEQLSPWEVLERVDSVGDLMAALR
ncbi:non-homologous end-joining DNA ligase [Aquipuribacter nitratireducens]|uniref:Non-homologous end-joining DNA ligase n=1 Tax=Aquipuribacter nitratireducens TaxID=650104 RepID=A0ABW0GP84_9MICO